MNKKGLQTMKPEKKAIGGKRQRQQQVVMKRYFAQMKNDKNSENLEMRSWLEYQKGKKRESLWYILPNVFCVRGNN